MTGGTLGEGPVSEKVSVRQLDAKLTATLEDAVLTTLPPTSKRLVNVIVVGPVITNVLKSSLICFERERSSFNQTSFFILKYFTNFIII